MNKEEVDTSHWCDAFLVVSFDKDVGGKIIAQNPSNATSVLGEYFTKQIVFLAFPDSLHINENGGVKNKNYTFRFPLTRSSIYCHVLFVQIPHLQTRESIQRSLVLLTKNKEIPPYHSLLNQLTPTFTENSLDVNSFLQVLSMKFACFPRYSVGQSVSLKLFGKRFDVTVSGRQRFPPFLRNHLRGLRSIWVSLLAGDSVVILGDDVCEVSETVEYLVGLIRPLEYFGEVRPYFTINDELVNSEKNLLVGITNNVIPSVLKRKRPITLVSKDEGVFIRNVFDRRFDAVKGMSDAQAGVDVEKEFERNTLEFLSIFDGFFIQKVPKMKTLEDPYVTVSYTIKEVLNYIKNLHFSNGKEEVYLVFVQSPSFSKYAASRILEIEAECLRQLNVLLDSFELSKYSHEQIVKISMNLFTLSKMPNQLISAKAQQLIQLIVNSHHE